MGLNAIVASKSTLERLVSCLSIPSQQATILQLLLAIEVHHKEGNRLLSEAFTQYGRTQRVPRFRVLLEFLSYAQPETQMVRKSELKMGCVDRLYLLCPVLCRVSER